MHKGPQYVGFSTSARQAWPCVEGQAHGGGTAARRRFFSGVQVVNAASSPDPQPPAQTESVLPQSTSQPRGVIVGMGASAGGLEAFETFFAHMPPDRGMAFVLVQHLAPDRASILPELLGRHTRMPVLQVQDETPVAPDHVYVIPPDATLTIRGGRLHLVSPPVEARGQRTPIDQFFSNSNFGSQEVLSLDPSLGASLDSSFSP